MYGGGGRLQISELITTFDQSTENSRLFSAVTCHNKLVTDTKDYANSQNFKTLNEDFLIEELIDRILKLK